MKILLPMMELLMPLTLTGLMELLVVAVKLKRMRLLIRRKGKKTSAVWLEFKEVTLPNGSKKGECIYCKTQLAMSASKMTTQFSRHLKSCVQRKIIQTQQKRLNFQPENPSTVAQILPALVDGKFDMSRMREAAAHWILMHEHPFSIVEEEGFNMMQKRGMPEWERVSRHTIKKDCMQVYESERRKLKGLLKTVDNVSLTTDLWKSTNQKIEYMVLTTHFIDQSWKLQKRVISFVHIPSPRRGIEIADCIFKCLKECGIENKVFTLSVDNAKSNNVVVRILKDTFSRNKKLLCDGQLFHVRCCAHFLNLMVQDGLSEIKKVIEDVHESVSFINQSEARVNLFSEIVQQLQLPERKLILDCKTRWNSTFEMLSLAIKFKEVFPMFKDREPNYNCCPSPEDWEKVEKVCDILKVFNSATQMISGSDYPTTNLFLTETYRVKVLLDQKKDDENEFIRAMVGRMKAKFDKYWGECNLIMAIATVLDPRGKMRAIDLFFPRMYSGAELKENKDKVRKALYDIYAEYGTEYQNRNKQVETPVMDNDAGETEIASLESSWCEVQKYVQETEISGPEQSDLDNYLNEGCFICRDDLMKFDALEWWKANTLKYRILSIMARDILAIPSTTVASESTFSAGGRVIDTYRSSLAPETVQALLCGGDWCRNLHGVKKKSKNEKNSAGVVLRN